MTLCTFLIAATLLAAADAPAVKPSLTHGPFMGAVDAHEMHVWARASAPGTYELVVTGLDRAEAGRSTDQATAENDHTLHWHVSGLAPAALYHYRVLLGGSEVAASDFAPLRTSSGDDANRATLVFGSCCDERRFPEQPVWTEIARQGADAIVLLGDTPYIDSSDLEDQRERYRAFFAFAPLRAARIGAPLYATWDDHDFAFNDAFGAIAGRGAARRAFLENHALGAVGAGDQGIFTRFRRGPIEVFLLDTRWFADAEPSTFDPSRRSLLGAAQWRWLEAGLAASTARFKILACGMVWNGAVRPGKRDCWGRWPHELEGLFAFIGRERIGGVALVGGDVHRARVIVHPVSALAGYDVPEFITSPLAASVIPANDVDVPGLVFDAGVPGNFLVLEGELFEGGAQLVARILDGTGAALFERGFAASALEAAR